MLLQLLVGEDKLMSMADALDDIKRKFQGFSPLHYGEVGSHAKCCPLVHLGVEHDRLMLICCPCWDAAPSFGVAAMLVDDCSCIACAD